MGRGQLHEKAQEQARKHLGREISLVELRLMPYVHYVMMNEQKLDPRKINQEERLILQKWKEEGHIEGGACGLAITKEFWDAMNAILFETYVAYDQEVYVPKSERASEDITLKEGDDP